jgi:lipoprotein-releasing system permease protein
MLTWHLFRHFIFSKRAGALVRRIASLSVIAISISVTAFLVVLFVMNGMNGSIKKRILGLEPHLYVQVPGVTSAKVLEAHPVFQRLKDEAAVEQVSTYETQDVIIRSQDGQFRGAIARGGSVESLQHFVVQIEKLDTEINPRKKTPTYHFSLEDIPGDSEILVGFDLAQTLGVFEGDYVTILSPEGLLAPPGEAPKLERVRIKRVITTSLSDLDAQYIFYVRGKALRVLGNDASKKLGIEAWLKNEADLDSVLADVQKFSDVKAETWKERNSALFYALMLEKLTIGTFLGLAGLIAASSILTVLALLLSQKKRDIAILRTLGFSKSMTVKTFSRIGFLLACCGILVGVFLGTSVSYYIQFHPLNLFQSDIYYDSSVPALVDPWLIVGVLVVSLGIGALGAYIPARTSIEGEPSEALRTK